MSDKVSRFHIGVNTKLLVNYLKDVPIGTKISYTELSTVIGDDITLPANRSTLASARKILIHEHNIIFGTIIKYGLKRLENEEIVLEGASGIRVVRRACKRAVRKVVCADYPTLSNTGKTKHNCSLSLLGTMHFMTNNKQQKRIESAVQQTMQQIDHTKLLEICKQ